MSYEADPSSYELGEVVRLPSGYAHTIAVTFTPSGELIQGEVELVASDPSDPSYEWVKIKGPKDVV